MTNAPTALVARTQMVPDELDLVALAGADGFLLERSGAGLAGRGVAVQVPLAKADEVLAGIASQSDLHAPGTGPVAFGALPFQPGAPARLTVPEIVWGHDDHGTCWVTTIGPADRGAAGDPDLLCRPVTPAPLASPTHVSATPVRSPLWWCDLVASATAAMRAAGPDGLRKVVLARELIVEADLPFDRGAILRRLRASYPGCYLFGVDGFIGASPELLVARRGEIVHAQPMAGTAPRSDDATADAALGAALLASATYRHEHRITIDMVYDTLLPWCSYLDYETEPSVVAVANVQHLATLVEGRLSQPTPSVLQLVSALHPTPAVNGWPADAATAWIREHEGFDRGRYAGAVGWVDGQGNGTWAVSIRCADVEGTTARLCAGNGIVADSDPPTELAETEAKLQAMLWALTPQQPAQP